MRHHISELLYSYDIDIALLTAVLYYTFNKFLRIFWLLDKCSFCLGAVDILELALCYFTRFRKIWSQRMILWSVWLQNTSPTRWFPSFIPILVTITAITDVIEPSVLIVQSYSHCSLWASHPITTSYAPFTMTKQLFREPTIRQRSKQRPKQQFFALKLYAAVVIVFWFPSFLQAASRAASSSEKRFCKGQYRLHYNSFNLNFLEFSWGTGGFCRSVRWQPDDSEPNGRSSAVGQNEGECHQKIKRILDHESILWILLQSVHRSFLTTTPTR